MDSSCISGRQDGGRAEIITSRRIIIISLLSCNAKVKAVSLKRLRVRARAQGSRPFPARSKARCFHRPMEARFYLMLPARDGREPLSPRHRNPSAANPEPHLHPNHLARHAARLVEASHYDGLGRLSSLERPARFSCLQVVNVTAYSVLAPSRQMDRQYDGRWMEAIDRATDDGSP